MYAAAASRRVIALLAAASLVAACKGGVLDADHVGVRSVAVSPDSVSLAVGTTRTLTATIVGTDGRLQEGRSVIWESGDSTIATVSDAGVVTAVRRGSVQVAASVEGVPAFTHVQVLSGAVQSVSVNPGSASVLVGRTTQLGVTLRDAEGNVLTGPSVSWASDNSAAATVSSTGSVTGVAPGTARITAASEGRSGSATVTVMPVPVGRVEVEPGNANLRSRRTVQLTAQVYDTHGQRLDGRVVTWSSNNTLIATVSESGLVTGNFPGEAIISATVDGKSGTARVDVRF